ncbi:uncharacterized protein [Drosophila bipectinata]|uniref:uncharacterized protein n=1 Tax=Drosophila bipectinata TaxID=42026 RepID=UPI0038B2A822
MRHACQAARPKLTTELLTTQAGVGNSMINTPNLCFSGLFPESGQQAVHTTKFPVVIDTSHVYGVDFRMTIAIDSLISDFNQRGQLLFFYNLKPSICAIFEQVSAAQFVVYYQEQQLDDLLKERNYVQKRLQKRPWFPISNIFAILKTLKYLFKLQITQIVILL